MVQPEQQLKEQQLKAKYASELHNIKTGLQTLKRKFYDRQNARAKLTDAQGQLASLGQIVDWSRQPVVDALKELQQIAATELLDPTSTLPITADALRKKILASSQAARFKHCLAHLPPPAVKRLVASLVLQECLVTANTLDLNGSTLLIITSVDRSGLADLAGISDPLAAVNGSGFLPSAPDVKQQQRLGNQLIKRQRSDSSSDLNSLLQFKSVKERERFEKGEELLELLDRKSARQQEALMKYQTGGAAVREHCPYLTKEACRNAIDSQYACPRLHQKKILYPWTDESLGNCSFLDTCRDVRRCKFIHYELDPEPDLLDSAAGEGGLMPLAVPNYLKALPSPQWIKCDIRTFDWSILGKFGVIMTDPPWEIHQDLPYGTMSDQELLGMGIKDLQDDGVIFMWVTGRALELGREMIHAWGYRRVDELIWVKTNSLQRLIRTGRTGHWLNHSKEHCLVGYKGNPNLNRFVDCDVLVSEVRETSRKPDEMYPLLERLSPGTRKLEIFARQHNVRPGWVSLGNQLDGTYITDPELLGRYTRRYGQPEQLRRPPPTQTGADYGRVEYAGNW